MDNIPNQKAPVPTHCHACLTKKDMMVLEKYPYQEEDHIISDPIDPLFSIDVEPDDGDDWRSVSLCHECFHKINADHWVSQSCLRLIECKTAFAELPKLVT